MTTTAKLRFRFAAAFTVAALLWLALPGCGSKSSSVTAPTVSSPASPANLQVAPGDQSNSVSWNASSGATSYNLYFKLGPGASKADSKLTGVVSPYTHGSLTNGTLYSYVVTAVNSAGESGASAAASATPAPASAPAPPANLQVAPGNQSNLVSWNAVSGATSYNLYFGPSAGASTLNPKLTGVVSPYTQGSLTNGTRYYYVVTAQNSVGESGASLEASATPTMGPIYVSWSTGNDVNDGTRATPVKTLAHATAIASYARGLVVLMEAGTYPDIPAFTNGVDVHGGYDLPGWSVGSTLTSFTMSFGNRGVADFVTTPTAISGIEVKTSLTSGGNSTALFVDGCTANLVFTNCRFVSAQGAIWGPGAPGVPGGPGANGADGVNGSCDGANGAGGAGGLSGGCSGGSGGAGGTEGGSGIGASGIAGNCLGGSGGSGGAVGDPGAPGAAGGDGGDVPNGPDGTPASGSGGFSSRNWFPFLSDQGAPGPSGAAGGGGGGGGGQQCFSCNNGGGNGGGGGGAGGSGGRPGQGGGGGYGSFAVLLFNSSPIFNNCTFQSGNGGQGGDGGVGGLGGQGGVGGPGASACTGEIGAGGKGGHGGPGGAAGSGAGGPGGPSYCVYKVNSTPTFTAPTYLLGSPGAGGIGGLHASGGGNAPNGGTGLSGNTN